MTCLCKVCMLQYLFVHCSSFCLVNLNETVNLNVIGR